MLNLCPDVSVDAQALAQLIIHSYTIYSIKDGQPCMDHDRSEGKIFS
jgi:hypothetical protein